MSSDMEKIQVICPKCGEEYADWYRPSLDPATSSTCPHCGFNLANDTSIRTEGPWIPDDDAPAATEG